MSPRALIVEVPDDWSDAMLVTLGDRLVASELPDTVSVYCGPLNESEEPLETIIKEWGL